MVMGNTLERKPTKESESPKIHNARRDFSIQRLEDEDIQGPPHSVLFL
jgi:hypothetical protein